MVFGFEILIVTKTMSKYYYRLMTDASVKVIWTYMNSGKVSKTYISVRH